MDDLITRNDIETAMIERTHCSGSFKVGQIITSPAGTGSAWVRCSVATANKLAGWETTGRMDISEDPTAVPPLPGKGPHETAVPG